MNKLAKLSLITTLLGIPAAFTANTFFGTALAADTSATTLKLGVVNANKFVSSIPSFLVADKKIKDAVDAANKVFAEEEKLLLKSRDDLQTKTQTFAAATQSLTEAKRKEKQIELQKEIEEFEKKADAYAQKKQASDQKFQEEKNQLIQDTLKIADQIISDYSSANKFTYIFNDDAVVWSAKGEDITDAVIKIAVDAKK